MTPNSQLSFVVADDLPLVAEGLAALCEEFSGSKVAAICHDGEQAWSAIQALRPDIVLLDLALSGMPAVEIIRRAREEGLSTRVIAMSSKADRQSVVETLRSGAHAFVLKAGAARQIEDACKQVLQGGLYLSPMIELQKLVEPERPEYMPDPLRALSARETQVFALLVDGIRAKEIAAQLKLSPKTIDTYRASLMRKLNLRDIPSLVKFAIRRNLTAVA